MRRLRVDLEEVKGDGSRWTLLLLRDSRALLLRQLARNNIYSFSMTTEEIAQVREEMMEIHGDMSYAVAYHRSTFGTMLGGATAFQLAAFVIKDRGFLERSTVRDFEDVFNDQRSVREECSNFIGQLGDIIRALSLIVPRWVTPRHRARPVRSALSQTPSKRLKPASD